MSLGYSGDSLLENIMIVRKENKLSPIIIILDETTKDIDFMLDMCYLCIHYGLNEKDHKMAEKIIDTLT